MRAIEIEIAGAKDTLATKHDLLRLESGWRGETTPFRARLQIQLAEVASTLRAEMGQHAAEFREEIQRSVGGFTRHMYTAILGQTAVLLGFAYFFATHVR